MLNDILTGRATLDGEKRESDPFRAPGEVQTITCSTCSAVVPASQAVGTRCRRCTQPVVAPAPQLQAPWPDPVTDYEVARAAQRAKGRTDIALGAVLLVAGILITSATYGSASQSGGTYIIAYGPILIGAIRLLRGLVRAGA